LVILGAAVSTWFLFRANGIESLGAFLAIGGLLSWLAFVVKIFPESEAKDLQKVLFGLLFEGHFAWILYLGMLVMFALVTASIGTLQLESLQSGADYQVTVFRQDQTPADDDRERLPANGRLRFVKFQPWWRSQQYTVRVEGFPEATVTLLPWWSRADRRVPVSFLRPVVLIGAEDLVVEQTRGKDRFAMTIAVQWNEPNGDPKEKEFLLPADYRGETVWIGCGRVHGVEIPNHALDWFRKSLAKPEIAPMVLNPVPLDELIRDEDRPKFAELPRDLTGVTVRASLKRSGDAKPFATGTLKVRHVRTQQDMVQLLALEKRQ